MAPDSWPNRDLNPGLSISLSPYSDSFLEPGLTADDVKQDLLAAEPTKFFTTDHCDGCPAVLVREHEAR